MSGTVAEAAPTLVDGKLVSSKVVSSIEAKIEKGALIMVKALVVHQTGGSSAKSALESYKGGANGAHFLVDKDGTIYQTARTTQRCWHVGEIQSRCYQFKSCTAEELKNVKAILFKQGESYGTRVSALHKHESAKAYPDRFPTNEDSLGIEIVSAAAKDGTYEPVTAEQNASLAWLVATLETLLGLSAKADVFRHPEVGYKQPTEASTATW
jgi:N-acetyl-anhydromuramyl-L-alanine amidase AmpD